MGRDIILKSNKREGLCFSLGNTTKFEISVKSIAEFDTNNRIVDSISLRDVTFTRIKVEGTNDIYNYSGWMPNSASISIVVSLSPPPRPPPPR